MDGRIPIAELAQPTGLLKGSKQQWQLLVDAGAMVRIVDAPMVETAVRMTDDLARARKRGAKAYELSRLVKEQRTLLVALGLMESPGRSERKPANDLRSRAEKLAAAAEQRRLARVEILRGEWRDKQAELLGDGGPGLELFYGLGEETWSTWWATHDIDEAHRRYQEWAERARAELAEGGELSTPSMLCHHLSGELFRYRYLVEELPAVDRPPLLQSPVSVEEMIAGDGADRIDLIQRHCRITEDSVGGRRGELLRLRGWQQAQLYRIFARDPATGERLHRVGLLGIPRKNGKSAVVSGLGLAEGDAGPEGGEIYCCAGDTDQARVIFETCKEMVKMDPYLAGRVDIYRDRLEWPETGTQLKVVSSESKRKEGYNPTLILFDEVHVQPNDDLWDVMEQGMGARVEPLMIGITTAGDPVDRLGNDTLCYRLYNYGRKIANGELEDRSFFFSWWEPKAGDRADWQDPDVWDETNPGLGDIVSLKDFEAKMKRGPETTVRTKRLNQWVPGKLAAFPAGAWDGIEADPELVSIQRLAADLMVAEDLGDVAAAIARMTAEGELLEFNAGSYKIEVPRSWLVDSILFLDGSWSGDSTGVVGCTREGFLFTVVHHEKTELDGPDWRVPVLSVEEDLRRAMNAGARGVLYDPHRWQRTGAQLQSEGYRMEEWPTNSVGRIVPAWKDFYNAVIDQDGISHDGSRPLGRHIGNIVLKEDNYGARPVKQRKGSTRHIDLSICALGAWVHRGFDFEDDAPGRADPWVDVA